MDQKGDLYQPSPSTKPKRPSTEKKNNIPIPSGTTPDTCTPKPTRIPQILMVAAIDFGTTYSGFAFSFRENFKRAPLLIGGKNWISTRGTGTMSAKTPSTLLLNSAKKIVGFGYEAEDTYADLAEENAHYGYYYFKNFKMMLHNNEKLNRETMLTDQQGHQLPALTVFTESIQYLKNELLKEVNRRGTLVEEDEIKWILTVPAIWDDKAKQFMREAAKNAGIEGSRLQLALEPEAASIYAKEMLSQRKESPQYGTYLAPYDPGTKFMVVDLGGGTVDVTLREVLEDRSLKELHKASGGAWGGMTVNEKIYDFIKELIGEKVLKELNENHKAEALDLERAIENKKRVLQGNKDGRILIPLPGPVHEIYERLNSKKLNNTIAFETKYAGKVDFKRNQLRIDKEIVAEFFDKSIRSIIKHLEELLKIPVAKGVTDMLLVGGFAESLVVQRSISDSGKFGSIKVVVPEDAGLAVVKGAVLFGHNPVVIRERVAKYTYGTRSMRYFLKDFDPEEKMEMVGKHPHCKDVFNKVAEINQTYTIGEASETEMYALNEDTKQMPLHLYRSTEPDPRYTTDESCSYLGKIVVDMPDTRGGRERVVNVRLIFCDTEILCEAEDQTSKSKVKAELDMLCKTPT